MRIPRIYTDQPLGASRDMTLEGSAANHVARVLRLKPGAALILFDGRGGEYPATLTGADKRSIQVRLDAQLAREVESPLEITLAQGISRGERMDYAIQKAVELGVSHIVPVITERTQVTLKGERLEKKLGHWQGIAISACEQCGRNRVPEVAPPVTLANWLPSGANGLSLVLDPLATQGLPALARPGGPVNLLIGPEGGLTDAEIAQACAVGFSGVRLGPRILRTETAAMATLSAIQLLWGDLG